jgi:Family of unknown function (DUF6152)
MNIKLAISAVLLGSLAAWGHHSFAAEYDAAKPITLKGTVIKMDWVNPHSWLHIRVTEEDGKVVEWLCETAPPNGLYRNGWRKDSLKEGEQVTVEGFRAKDSTNTITARSVVTADGRKMFAGTATDGAPDSKK